MKAEEEKYYTPESGEFKDGFEYEYLEGNNRWIEDSVLSVFDPTTMELIQDSFNQGGLRVKHLDKSDIESLDWVYQKSNDYGYDYFTLKKNAFKDYYILFSSRTKRIVIGLSGEYTFTGEGTPLFDGWTKNKSVFKQVLKMIGI